MDSTEIAAMIEAGESVKIEFKADFPAQARDLAKEIAALASTEGGVILMGVNDDGQVIGLDGSQTQEGIKTIKERINGICAQSIDPPVFVQLHVEVLQSRNIVVIEVPNKSDEVHFVSGRPYIRCLSVSRPATSQEVKERILLADILKRLNELEEQVRPGAQVAPGIMGQGELATMNKADLANWLIQQKRRQFP